jgi:hypothetical protein
MKGVGSGVLVTYMYLNHASANQCLHTFKFSSMPVVKITYARYQRSRQNKNSEDFLSTQSKIWHPDITTWVLPWPRRSPVARLLKRSAEKWTLLIFLPFEGSVNRFQILHSSPKAPPPFFHRCTQQHGRFLPRTVKSRLAGKCSNGSIFTLKTKTNFKAHMYCSQCHTMTVHILFRQQDCNA